MLKPCASEAARHLIESGKPLMVCKTVLLELEWVMRGYYGFTPVEISGVLRHLMALPQVMIEDRNLVEQAIAQSETGLDMADALHHAATTHAKAWLHLTIENSPAGRSGLGSRHVLWCPGRA